MNEFFIYFRNSLLTIVFGGLLCFFLLKILFKNTIKGSFLPIRAKDGRLQRRLGPIEQASFASSLSLDGTGNDVTVLLINSKISLRPGLVQKALCLINQRYPLLRMKVYKNTTEEGLWFQEVDDPSRISFKTLEDHSALDWIQVFEEESRVSFDLFGGPLWRVTMLQEHYDTETKQYENSLVFTFHHMICDGTAIMTLYSQFLEYLNDLQQGKDVKVESMVLLPPCSYLLGTKIQASIFERIFYPLLKFKNLLTKPTKNLFMKVFPPPIMQDPSIIKRTSVIPKIIKSEELSELIKIGKQHNCTVHGIITAATRLAMAQVLQSGPGHKLPNPLQFSSAFNVSVRTECQPEIKMIEFGCFVSLVRMSVPIPCDGTGTQKESFWKFAQTCTDTVHKKVKAKEHYHSLNANTQTLFPSHKNLDSEDNGRTVSTFCISNRGRFTIGDVSKNVAFNFAGTYFGVAEQHVGPTFCHNIVSVNGDLYWGLIYYPNITTKLQAEQFIELSLGILREACSF